MPLQVFGGGYPATATQTSPCASISLRIGLGISATGVFTFDPAWVIEDMPGSRCVLNAIVLPNGYVVLTGGGAAGFGGFADFSEWSRLVLSKPGGLMPPPEVL